ncbi:sulfite exporter TauE/SafE family protein [Hydrogenobacter hydrogenophilus]|uniref:Probable membrane transporter protein n=1 Tax=Hydrogenobacter hydrogenophilus TaxID=35835 RepID=A0A285P084_9AQUI|nr:sulfite exporter TauE/SafE family protein [Hydrogenobacter hydrogenophilus]SNZ14848.1 hypothetical protein SAMN06265353_1228 [Hydrogenobacter hydrogenophilus]
MFEYAVFGFFIAFAIGLTGVGAGTLTAPLLILLGLDPAKAVGSALAFSTVVKFPAVLTHAVYKNLDYKTLLLMLVGGVPGTLLGSLLLKLFHDPLGLKKLLLLVIGITIIFSVLLNLLMIWKGKRFDLSRYKYLLPVACFLIGLEVGFTSAGAGALGMVLLLYFTKLSPARAVGVDIAFGLACSFVGGTSHFLQGHTDTGIFLPMSLGGLAGVLLGTHLARTLNPKPLRIVISLLLVAVAINLIQKGLR